LSPSETGLINSSRNGYATQQANYQMQDLSAEFQQFGVSLSAAATATAAAAAAGGGGMYMTSPRVNQPHHSYQQQQQESYSSSMSGHKSLHSSRCESAPPGVINTHYTNSSSSSSMRQHTAAAAAAEQGSDGYPLDQRHSSSRSGTHQSRAQHSTTHNGVYAKQQPASYGYIPNSSSSRSEVPADRNAGCYYEQPFESFTGSGVPLSKHGHSSSNRCSSYYEQPIGSDPAPKHGYSSSNGNNGGSCGMYGVSSSDVNGGSGGNSGSCGMYGGRVSPVEAADEYRSRNPGCSRALGQSGVQYASRNINPPSPIWR
jgi:hypothetical protein